MPKSLVIVESPAKAKTIKKYLGKGFSVEASSGHLVDLPSSKLGVDVDNDFEPDYVVIKDKKPYLAKLKKAAKGVDTVYLASDPDREGEAIAWHIANQLKITDKVKRILIYEITEKAIKDAVNNPLELSQNKFEAQQARRILDRLVGYQVSPILWKKVRKGLSAGRVQSVALRIIDDREAEIEAFNTVEYWTIEADLDKSAGGGDTQFSAKLSKYDGKKIEIGNEALSSSIVESVKNEPFKVASIEKKERLRKASPPFITSTLQREASLKLRYSVRKTMMLAQRLYEGIELGDRGPVGLITYMRTDSIRISPIAQEEAVAYITEKYGESYVPKKPNVYKQKKSAQDAHEAIRPTSFDHEPDTVKNHLSNDEYKLYELIWKRFISSQMTPSIYDQTSVDIEAGKGIFRASGSVVKFKGFTAVYTESMEEHEKDKDKDREETKSLPAMSEGDILKLLNLEGIQHFTQPPPRFTESSLVKELEELGIGRPSTYAAILSTILDREYVVKEKNKLKPTVLGRAVTGLLKQGFPEIMDIKFTAEMEENLDKVEEGKENWVNLLKKFYKGFSERLKNAETTLKSLKREGLPTDIVCELCDAPMIIKWGKRGEFLSCSTYPECKNAKRFKYDDDGKIEIVTKKEQEIHEDVKCDLCGKAMALRSSRYGKFFGCTGYPGCKGIKKLKDVEKTAQNDNAETQAGTDDKKDETRVQS